ISFWMDRRKGSRPGSSSRYLSSVPSGRLRASDSTNDVSARIRVARADALPAMAWLAGDVPSAELFSEAYDDTFTNLMWRASWAFKHSNSTFGPSCGRPFYLVTVGTRSFTAFISAS